MDSWYRLHCPQCKENNWICNGDENDITGMDIEACECWNCDHRFWLDEEYANVEFGYKIGNAEDEYSSLDEMLQKGDAMIERGRESPNDPFEMPKKS